MNASCALIVLLTLGAAGPDPAVVDPDPRAKQPQACVDERGTVFVAYGVEDAIHLAVSHDGGALFERSASAIKVPKLMLGMRRGPRVAAAQGAVVVSAIGSEKGDLMAWRSTDEGRTWSEPARVNRVAKSAQEGLHALATGADGRLFLAWLDIREGKMAVFGSASRDGGVTWDEDRAVYRSPTTGICPCCHPSAAFGGDGTLAVMWRNEVDGSRDLYVALSKDGGTTFGAAEKLGRKTWKLSICPMDGGAVAIGPRGEVASAWMRAGSAFSASAGEAERPLGDGPGVQPWMTWGPKGPLAVVLTGRPGALVLHRTEGKPVVLADRANDPVIASPLVGKGPVISVWEQPDAGIRARVIEP